MPTDANDAIDSERIIVKYFNIYIDGSKNTSVYAISYKIWSDHLHFLSKC